ncbi:MAG: sugar ABC transporter substrate-binding protein [Tepidisphaeraceae bacterium]
MWTQCERRFDPPRASAATRGLASLLVLTLGLGIGGVIAGCDDGKPSGAPAANRYKIGFANIAEDFPFAVRVREGIERAAKQAGNVDLVVMNNRMDGQTALSNADNFLVQGVKGVIEFQTDEQFGLAIMDKFNAEKIPVIAIDIPMKGAVFFGVNNTVAGKMAGEGLGNWIKKNWEGKVDALIMLELPQSGPVPAERMKGQRDGLEAVVGKIDEAKVKHLDSKNTLEEAHRLVKDALSTLPDAHRIAVVCINDDTALGAIGAAEAAGRKKDIAVVAVDGSDRGREEIRKADSPMVGTTASFPEKYGDKLIPLMIGLMRGEQPPDAVYTDHAFLTRDSIGQYYPQ